MQGHAKLKEILVASLAFLVVLSRFGLLSVLRVSVALTDSMEPSIRSWNLVLYVAAGHAVGGVVVYSPTPATAMPTGSWGT